MRAVRPVPILLIAAAVLGASAPVVGAADLAPRQQLEAVAKSLAAARSYRMTITGRDDDGRSTIRATVAGSRADVSVTIGKGGTFRVRKVPSATYLRGDGRYWRAALGSKGRADARRLADRWIRVEKGDDGDFTALLDAVSAKSIAACLVAPESTGTLTAGPTASVGGRKAGVLVDAGDKPGTAPSKIFYAASGDPVPLRLLQTGKVRPGGPSTDCTDPDDTSTSSETRFSDFGAKLSIPTPKRPLKAPGGSGSGSGSGSGTIKS
jgi:hypothetical protein